MYTDLIIYGVVAIIIIAIYSFVPVSLSFRARAFGVKISIFELLRMRWQKIPVDDLLHCLIEAKKHGMEIKPRTLKNHYLAGGDMKELTKSLINNGK